MKTLATALLLLSCAGLSSMGAQAATSASGGGTTLPSVSVELPSGGRAYPGTGPGAEVMNGNCASCHSAGMVLTQPHLTRAEWQGEVTKMLNVYKAPVDPADVPAIVDYLVSLPPAS